MEYLDKLKQRMMSKSSGQVAVPEIDWDAVRKNSPIEGVDTDNPIMANTDTDKSAYKQAVDLKPSVQGRYDLDQISEPKEEKENVLLSAAEEFGDSLQKGYKAPSAPQLGSVQQAMGQSNDVLDAKRKALLKMMGR